MVSQALDRFDHIDAQVNTVAIRPSVGLVDMTWEQWQRVLDINLGATVRSGS